MSVRLSAPIGILDEHPEWSARLIAELEHFYDVNATSNFVADAPAVLGFDPFPRFADYIVRVATARG
jgi:hypothetical protein